MNESEKIKHKDTESIDRAEKAYNTLVNWVKNVPYTIEEIKKRGSKEELKNFKQKVIDVIEKLKDIESELKSNRTNQLNKTS